MSDEVPRERNLGAFDNGIQLFRPVRWLGDVRLDSDSSLSKQVLGFAPDFLP